MENYNRLNSSQVKNITKILQEQYAIPKLKLHYRFYKNNKGRIFIISPEIESLDLKKIRINNLGLYFANHSDNSLRLTIEGSQLIGPIATQNVIEINEEELKEWMRGEILNKKITTNEFVIIKHEKDYYGSGRRSGETIANFLPKSRRIKSYKTPELLN